MTKTAMIILLTLLIMLSPNMVLADETRPMGRCVESSIELPNDVYTMKLSSTENGRPMVLGSSQLGLVTSVLDGSDWSKTDTIETSMDWQSNDILHNIAQRGEETYTLIYRLENHNPLPHIQRDQDGQLIDIALDLGGSYPSNLELAANDRLITQSPEGDLLIFDTLTCTLLERYAGLGGAVTVQGTALFAVSMANRCVLQYDLETGDLIGEMTDAPITGSDLLASDGESLFLANSGGIYRITPGRSIWEQLIAGNLTSLILGHIFSLQNTLAVVHCYHRRSAAICTGRDGRDLRWLRQLSARI